MRGRRLAIALGLVTAAVVAALPFFHTPSTPADPDWDNSPPPVSRPIVARLAIRIGGEETREGHFAKEFRLVDDDEQVLARGPESILEHLAGFPPEKRAGTDLRIGLLRGVRAEVLARLLREIAELGYSRVRVYPIDPD